MTMHLLHPMYTTTGKRKGKQKWASAEQKRQAEQLEREWQAVLSKHQPKTVAKTTTKSASKLPKLSIPEGRGTKHIPSVDTGLGTAAKVQERIYTGTEVIGIAVMHKSCLQPVFNKQAAEDIAKMRRN